jgi:hypothetical protein
VTAGSALRIDRSDAWERAVAAALDFVLARRGDRVRASEIWSAIRAREPFRILVLTREGSEVDRTDDRATQIAEVRQLMTALHRRVRPASPSESLGDPADPEYVVLR